MNTIIFKKEELDRLEAIEKEVNSWPKWKFLGSDCLLHRGLYEKRDNKEITGKTKLYY